MCRGIIMMKLHLTVQFPAPFIGEGSLQLLQNIFIITFCPFKRSINTHHSFWIPKIVALIFLMDVPTSNLTGPDVPFECHSIGRILFSGTNWQIQVSSPITQPLNKLSSFAFIFAKVVKESSALLIDFCSCNYLGTHRAHWELAQAKIFCENWKC